MPAWHAPNLAINCIENTREKNASEDPYQYGSFFSLLHSGRFEVIYFSLHITDVLSKISARPNVRIINCRMQILI